MKAHCSASRSRLASLALALAVSSAVACQSSSSSQKDAAAPAAEATEADAPPEEGAQQPESVAPPASPSKEIRRTTESKKENEAVGATLDAEEEPAAAPADDLLERKEAGPSPELRLAAEQDAFDAALDPTELSCAGARPHRDAICSLAARLCKQEGDAVLDADKQCEGAKQQCDSVRERYREACGE